MKRLLAGAGCLALAALAALVPAAPGLAESAGSAVTVEGRGPFAGLKVTVGATRNLVNQVVEVSWTGGTPTEPSTGTFSRHFLQIMQCWGDDPAGPAREQCQFGGIGDGRGGDFVAGRQASYGSQLVDPEETYRQAEGSHVPAYVPFRSVTGKTVTGSRNEFFDAYSSNEVPLARTRSNGTGQEYVEIQTGREAAGLGCGRPGADGTPRRCWLVVVPRGDVEVNGTRVTQSDALRSSPLSASNWAHRLVVPLHFQPLGVSCAIGTAERPTYGQELVAEAITRWQPGLCAATKTIFGYAQVSDRIARRQLASGEPGLVFLSEKPPAGQEPAGREPVYAPVALSGLTVAFVVDSQSSSKTPPEIRKLDGTRITTLDLTPRLVAKLVTQSYRLGVHYAAPQVAGNPADLTRDPDFLALNPRFKELFFPGIYELLLPLGLSDATAQLWRWLDSDADARAFLDGKPDPWGMTVNPHYKQIELPRDDFPKSDPYCHDFADGSAPWCTLDAHPYAADLHDAARSASRGDTLVRGVWDGAAQPPSWKKGPPQLSGTRAVLAFTDTATAARYGLPTARLRNAAGTFVAPTTAGMLDGSYPLTSLTYAATVPSALDAAARRDYAALLRYAAGPGQQPGVEPGRLPEGYAPLPERLRAQTRAIAEALVAPPRPVVTSRTQPSASATAPAPAPAAGSVTTRPVVPPPAPVPPAATAPPKPVAFPTPPVPVSLTPPQPAGAERYTVAALLLLGVLAAVAGVNPPMTSKGRR